MKFSIWIDRLINKLTGREPDVVFLDTLLKDFYRDIESGEFKVKPESITNAKIKNNAITSVELSQTPPWRKPKL